MKFKQKVWKPEAFLHVCCKGKRWAIMPLQKTCWSYQSFQRLYEILKGNWRKKKGIHSTILDKSSKHNCVPQEFYKWVPHFKCLTRNCDQGGIDKFKLLSVEVSESGEVTGNDIYTFRQANSCLMDRKRKKCHWLTKKNTPSKELFASLARISLPFLYGKAAKGTNGQLNWTPHLQWVVCMHDDSEVYSCRQQDELQSEYFDAA